KYTRDGSFTLNVDGALVNKNGDFLLSTNNTHIILDPTQDFRVDRQGVIYQNDVAMAQIQVTDFEDYDYLERYGENYFQPVEGATPMAATAQVYGGYLEASNVQVVREMVDLISFTRAYESNQKIVQAYDETLGTAVNDVGKL
ncbi:MAG: flagellar basal body and hook protein, partial [Parasporobacterium sp.]|nr:flagellar basal body and hook protein [Parasporobacterium sp.]